LQGSSVACSFEIMQLLNDSVPEDMQQQVIRCEGYDSVPHGCLQTYTQQKATCLRIHCQVLAAAAARGGDFTCHRSQISTVADIDSTNESRYLHRSCCGVLHMVVPDAIVPALFLLNRGLILMYCIMTCCRYSHPDEELMQSDWSQLQQQQQQQGEGDRQHKRPRLEEQQLPPPPQQQQHEEPQTHAAAGADEQQPAGDVQQSTAPAADAEQQQGGAAAGEDSAADAAAVAAAADGSSRRELVAVVLEFTLPPSCYATMLVRELTKSSTSKASHAKLSAKA
jgi:hypothetical protein